MVTLNVYGGKANEFFSEFYGLSTDVKPTITFTQDSITTPILNGSLFLEIDTSDIYAYNEGSQEWTKLADVRTYVDEHFVAGSNIEIRKNADGTATINASGEVSSEDSVARASIASHEADTSNPHAVTKAQVGLGNVDNTADIDKPISTAVQAALTNKVDAVSGKGLSTEDYTTAEKTKLSGIETDANKTVVDTLFSAESNNPVANSTIVEILTIINNQLNARPYTEQVYSLARRSCYYINNSASGKWAKIADMTTTATSTQHRTLVLLVVQSYLGSSAQAYEQSNGILQVKIRAMGSGFDRGQLKWLVAESGIDVSNFVLVYKNNGDSCTTELWCRNAAQTLTYTFTVLADVNKGSGVDGQFWTLYNSTTGADEHDAGDGSITSTVSPLLQAS